MVSVVMAVCLQTMLAEKAIRSTLAQTYADLELIVLDEGDDEIPKNDRLLSKWCRWRFPS